MSATHGEQPDGRPCTSRGTAARGREEPRFPVRMLSFSRGSSSNHEVPRKSRYSPRSPECAADPSPAVSPRGFVRAGVRLVKAPREMYISCAAPRGSLCTPLLFHSVIIIISVTLVAEATRRGLAVTGRSPPRCEALGRGSAPLSHPSEDVAGYHRTH